MKGETHQVGGRLVWSHLRLPYTLLYLFLKPNSLLSLVIMYFIQPLLGKELSLIGSLLPDYDQLNYENCPKILNKYIGIPFNKMLVKWGASHRSAHTHNVDLWVLFLGIPTFAILALFIITSNDLVYILFGLMLSLMTGVLSHIFLDLLNVTGCNLSYIKIRRRKKDYQDDREYRKFQSDTAFTIKPKYKSMKVYNRFTKKGVKTPFKRREKIHAPTESWGKTGGPWELEIYYMMNREWSRMSGIYNLSFELIVILVTYYTFK